MRSAAYVLHLFYTVIKMSRLPARTFDELALFNLVKKGNPSAFQTIYNCYWEKLFAYTFNRLHVRAASEEVVQDVFLALWQKREFIVITGSLSAYLYGATRHRLLNELRSLHVRQTYASDYALFVRNTFDNSNVETQDVNDLQRSMEASILELPNQCQTVFRLSRLSHVSNEHIAQRLNISTKTVENYLTQALKYCRASLGEFLTLLVAMAIASQ
jgi:RNA polymerase sigma-70 factor (family 1)